METIITIFTVLSMFMNLSQSTDSQYFYNADIEDGIVKTMYVYNYNGEGLTPKLACHYTYDLQGRLIEKEVCRWDMWTKEYCPDYKMELNYHLNGYDLTRSDWNKKEQDWTPSKDKAIYHIENEQLLSVSTIHRDIFGNYETYQLHIINSMDSHLLARQ